MDRQQPLQQPALAKNKLYGFTLVELLIIIAIVGILGACIVNINMPTTGGIKVSYSANQLATDIRLAQSLAMDLNQRRQVNFSANSYSVTDTSNNPAWLNSGSIAFDPNISITSSTPVSIIFNGRGIPYTNSTTTLSSTFQVVLKSSAGDQRTINIYPTTGVVGVTSP